MGNPHLYYIRALQCFTHALAFDKDVKLAKTLLEESSEEKLQAFILQKTREVEKKSFYFTAGRAFEYVLHEAEEEGCDAFNASVSGLNKFFHFIVGEDDEKG